MKKNIVIVSAIGLLLLGAESVQAKEVTFVGEKCPLTVSTVVAATENSEVAMESEVIDIEKMNILGKVDADTVAVIVKDKLGYVEVAELTEKVPMLELETLPDASSWKVIEMGAQGEDVKEIQELMISLGVLGGYADGQYGYGSAGAVSEFQAANGLPVNGTVDAETYLMLKNMGVEEAGIEVTYPQVFTVEEKFASICDYTEMDLNEYLTPDWKFHYDVYDGFGEITNNDLIGEIADNSSDVARIEIKAYRTLFVTKTEEGMIDIVPALKICSSGAYRPYVGSVQIRVGNDVVECPMTKSVGELDGTTVKEATYLMLDEITSEMLAKEAELKINGQNKSYIVAQAL